LVSFSLTLRPGLHWTICAADEASATIVTQMAKVMELPACTSAGLPTADENPKRLVVISGSHDRVPGSPEEVIFQMPDRQPGWKGLFGGQVQVSLALARAFLPQGGLLLHGTLAELMGQGALFGGASGVGKTTTSRRLPPPWRSLCDDTTLVTPDAQGRWWAHPWPTWSLCIEGGPSGSWNVSSAVPLAAIFLLKQASLDRVAPLRPGRAVARLVQAAEEASPLAAEPQGGTRLVHALRLQRFDWLSVLARTVPAFTLELSLTGAFWQEIENTLGWNTRCA
jgi:hypothetical protein